MGRLFGGELLASPVAAPAKQTDLQDPALGSVGAVLDLIHGRRGVYATYGAGLD